MTATPWFFLLFASTVTANNAVYQGAFVFSPRANLPSSSVPERSAQNVIHPAPHLSRSPKKETFPRTSFISASFFRSSQKLEDNQHEGCSSLSTTNRRVIKLKRTTITAFALGLIALANNSAVSHAASKSAAAVNAPLALPALSTLLLACLLPTLLGYYRSEYGVSYGYGTAMATSSYLILSSIATSAGLPIGLPSFELTSFGPVALLQSLVAFLGTSFHNMKSLAASSLPAFHATALLFYGTRLDLFLLYRELCLPRFRAMRERIEERAMKQGGRWKRTPFILSCAFLYYCMVCPLIITSNICGDLGMIGRLTEGSTMTTRVLAQCLRTTVVVAKLGFILGALGDLNKSIGKAVRGEDSLITGGVFRFFRHPNYTGEVIGWVSSCIAGFLAVAWKIASNGAGGYKSTLKSMAPYLVLSVVGATGISFVLGTATAGLEYRQREKYGDTEEYKEWVKKSWVGFQMVQQNKLNNGGDDVIATSGDDTS